MAKKNPETSIVQVIIHGLDNNNLVQKSRPLLQMKKVPFSLGELKVLDTYLSRINSHDETVRTVKFSKEEYEDLMGIERMRPDRIRKYVENLMGHTVYLPNEQSPNGWRLYTLFTKAICYQDEYAQWWIDLTCSEEARELFFNIEKIGYIRYKLSNILPLTSKYSVLLYMYLLDNRFREKWLVPVSELRETILQCDTEFYKNSFRNFKQDILNKTLSEVNAKTDLKFMMSTTVPHCKIGRNIVNIEFKLIKDRVKFENHKQLTLPLADEDKEEQYSPHLRFIAGAVDYEFDNDEMQMICAAISELRTDPNHREIQRYNFLITCYRKMNYHHKKKEPVKNRFKYFLSIVENDVKKHLAGEL